MKWLAKFKGRRKPRLTGISTVVGGVSWEWSESERDTLRHLVTYLEDRRVLSLDFTQMSFSDFAADEIEEPDYVNQSLMNIRERLTAVLQELPEGSPAADPIRAMRTACTEYLTFIHAHRQKELQKKERSQKEAVDWSEDPFVFNYFITLGQLRAVIGRQLAILQDEYGLAIHDPLAQIIPGKAGDVEKQYVELKQDINESLDIAKRRAPGRYDDA
jgi:hypothetical protein